ncbi:MAG: hypothetical protein ACOXZR_01905 [Bacilli bacterium]|jgi:hypothetical protein
MKEATGELNMTIITVIAIAAIGVFLWLFLPGVLENIRDTSATGSDADPHGLQP